MDPELIKEANANAQSTGVTDKVKFYTFTSLSKNHRSITPRVNFSQTTSFNNTQNRAVSQTTFSRSSPIANTPLHIRSGEQSSAKADNAVNGISTKLS
jgi:hypothetical protein